MLQYGTRFRDGGKRRGAGHPLDPAIAMHTILKCDDDAKSVLKERAKEMRHNEKKARKKS